MSSPVLVPTKNFNLGYKIILFVYRLEVVERNIIFIYIGLPNKHATLTQCCINVGTSCTMPDEH